MKEGIKIKKYTDIPIDEFLDAIEVTLNSSYFLYKNKYYKQIEGCAMGASILSVIAQFVMEDLGESFIANSDIHLPFFLIVTLTIA